MLNVGTCERNLNSKFFSSHPEPFNAHAPSVRAVCVYYNTRSYSFGISLLRERINAREQQRQAQLEIELSSARQVI